MSVCVCVCLYFCVINVKHLLFAFTISNSTQNNVIGRRRRYSMQFSDTIIDSLYSISLSVQWSLILCSTYAFVFVFAVVFFGWIWESDISYISLGTQIDKIYIKTVLHTNTAIDCHLSHAHTYISLYKLLLYLIHLFDTKNYKYILWSL